MIDSRPKVEEDDDDDDDEDDEEVLALSSRCSGLDKEPAGQNRQWKRFYTMR